MKRYRETVPTVRFVGLLGKTEFMNSAQLMAALIDHTKIFKTLWTPNKAGGSEGIFSVTYFSTGFVGFSSSPFSSPSSLGEDWLCWEVLYRESEKA